MAGASTQQGTMRELAAVLAREADAMGPAVLAHVVERIPGLDAEGEAQNIAMAAVRANIAAFADALGHDVSLEHSEAPLMAIVHARRLARAGIGLDGILRLYRLGEEWLFERLCRIADERFGDSAGIAGVLEQAGLAMLRAVDAVSVRVATEYEAEREAMLRGTLARREALVRSILGGERVELGAAEGTLGYRLGGWHVAFLCWTLERPAADAAASPVEDAVRALATALDAPRPLVIAEGPALSGAWIGVTPDLVVDRGKLEGVLQDIAPGARAAFGAPRPGIDGFRESRGEAERARAVAAASVRDPVCVLYQDVALVGLLSDDMPAARRYVRDQLGNLAVDDTTHGTLRRTVLEVFQANGSHKVAAHVLGVHRNTIAHRLARAEEMLGQALDTQRRELETALLLAHWLGSQVLEPPPQA